MTDPRIAVLSALSAPGWHPVPEAHGMPWDEAEELLAAYDASRAAVPSAPADRAALRDRIAETLTAADFECDGNCGLSEQDCYDAHPISFSAMSNGVTHVTGSVIAIADAVLAVLPAPGNRAAVLEAEVEQLTEASRRLLEQRQEMAEERFAWQERGDRAEARVRELEAGAAALTDTDRQFLTFALDQAAEEMSLGDGFTDEDQAALEKLRRMAGEAQQPTPCSQPNPCEDGGDPCATHEREQAHAEGDHGLCGADCHADRCTCDSEDHTHDGGCPLYEPDGEVFELPGPEVVAYRNPDRPSVLLCREHGDGWWGLTPLTSDDLPDGGTCTYGDPADPDDVCGRDVLIAEPRQADTAGEQQ